MVMAERYGIPSTKIISLMSAWKVPFRNVQAGDRLLVMTDDSMDPMVWQSAMAALQERGAEVTLALYPRRTYHCGDPTAMAVSAAKETLEANAPATNAATDSVRCMATPCGLLDDRVMQPARPLRRCYRTRGTCA